MIALSDPSIELFSNVNLPLYNTDSNLKNESEIYKLMMIGPCVLPNPPSICSLDIISYGVDTLAERLQQREGSHAHTNPYFFDHERFIHHTYSHWPSSKQAILQTAQNVSISPKK